MAKKGGVIFPIATAMWLIDNTCLTFKQIAAFCNLDEKEVKSMADGLLASGIRPFNPISNGSLTRQEIQDREKDGKPLKSSFHALDGYDVKIQKQKKYIPVIQRRSRPEAVLWLLQYAPELLDSQIIKLVRTTKNMIQMIRDKAYDGYNELVAKDPVIIGFCTQKELDFEVEKARTKKEQLLEEEAKAKERKKKKAAAKKQK